MKLLISLTAAAVLGATSSTTSGVHQKKNMRGTTHKDHSGINQMERNVDVINQIQLADQEFWDRSLSMSFWQPLGDAGYGVSERDNIYGCQIVDSFSVRVNIQTTFCLLRINSLFVIVRYRFS